MNVDIQILHCTLNEVDVEWESEVGRKDNRFSEREFEPRLKERS